MVKTRLGLIRRTNDDTDIDNMYSCYNLCSLFLLAKNFFLRTRVGVDNHAD